MITPRDARMIWFWCPAPSAQQTFAWPGTGDPRFEDGPSRVTVRRYAPQKERRGKCQTAALAAALAPTSRLDPVVRHSSPASARLQMVLVGPDVARSRRTAVW
jgi:hypothetical protein